MAIGRPIELTPNIATKNISALATDSQTQFTVTGGYRINEIAVYRNGVRLAEGRDFTASDGDTVNLVTAASASDVIEFSVFDSFNISDAIVSAASSQNLNGDFNVTGTLYSGDFKPGTLTVGVATVSTSLHVGSALTANAAGDVQSIGIITAASFSGSGANLTGIAVTANIVSVAITTKDINVSAAATITGALTGSTGTFSGAVNVDATTDSTSSSTGALIVDGGLGVAKNVYIGAGLSVAGTLTYEDVTNVDSVGLITAKSGVNITGGELKVGTAVTISSTAGVSTFSGDVIFDGATENRTVTWDKSADTLYVADNAVLSIGGANDLRLYHNGTNSAIDNATGQLNIAGADVRITNKNQDENQIICTENEGVSLYHNAIKTFETIGSGITITGPEAGAGIICISADEGDDNADKWRLEASASSSELYFQNYASGSWESNIKLTGNGGVHLYYDNSAVCYTATDALRFNDSQYLKFGNSQDLSIVHNGTNSIINNNVGDLYIQSDNNFKIEAKDGGNDMIHAIATAQVELHHNGTKTFQTTREGVEVIGFTSTTAGMGVTGGLFEGAFIKAGKLSDNKTLGISTANVFYFTTQETTTATPDIRWDDSYTLSSKMAVGEVASVTVITTAAAGGYSANWTIDGNAVTEEWVGGSAPSAGGSGGLDIYSFTIIKTGTGTGDSGWKVIGNLSNAT